MMVDPGRPRRILVDGPASRLLPPAGAGGRTDPPHYDRGFVLLTRLDLRGRQGPFDEVLPRPRDAGVDVHDAVAAILARVRAEGDGALRALTEQFDRVVLDELRVPPAEVEAARERVPAALRDALSLAAERIAAYHAHEGAPPGDLVTGGLTVRHLERAVERAGCYAPGGRA